MKKLIHVYQQRIRSNAKLSAEERKPPVIVRQGRKSLYGSGVVIHGPSRLVYSPEAPLACGAKLWIETTADVDVLP